MAVSEHEVELAVGRRTTDGHVRLSVFAREMLALTAEGTSERAPTLLLTLEQARSLRSALDGLIALMEEGTGEGFQAPSAAWHGKERRAG